MCGINLLIGESAGPIVHEMNETIIHRGIRNKVYFNHLFGIGHVRLPIQGCSEAYDQPFQHKGLIGAFVGEIFNFKEIDPNAQTDFPVLMKSFSKTMSSQFFNNNFDGFWSAIFVDNKHAYIVTDYLAKKPLYIRRTKTYIAISSEIKALKKLGPVTEDKLYFSCVRKWGYNTNHLTPYKEITKLKANCEYKINLETRNMGVRSNPPLRPKRSIMFKKILEKSIKNRLVSDVPISLLLSGGIDSTIIFELMKKFTKDFTVFHVDNNESEYLNHLNFTGIKLKQITLKDTSIIESCYWNETPVDLGSVIPQLALSKALRAEKINVALSGDGADEIFGGYKRMSEYDSQYSDIFEELVFYHLPRLDKLMMANTIELRSPFMAKDVIEFGMSVPYKLRINKLLLKDAFKDTVPKYIIERKKEPLRYSEMKKDKIHWRQIWISTFRDREGWNECK